MLLKHITHYRRRLYLRVTKEKPRNRKLPNHANRRRDTLEFPLGLSLHLPELPPCRSFRSEEPGPSLEQPRTRAMRPKVRALLVNCEALYTDLGVCNPKDRSPDPRG